MEYIQEFLNVFVSISVEMAPWLMLGLLFAGILHVFLPNNYIQKQLGGNKFKHILKAILLGIPLPLCSCGVIPTAIHIHKNGASKATTNAFLISTPQTGVDSILATFALLGLPFAIIRPLIALFSGLFGGLITAKFDDTEVETVQVYKATKSVELSIKQKIKKVFIYGFVDMLEDLTKWLLIGLVLATCISMLIPDNFFQDYVSNYYAQMLLILLISLPLYVCATGSIPIAMVLLAKGLSPSLVILFLMVGPATNIATVVMIMKAIGKKTFLLYLFSIAISGLVFTLFVEYTIPKEWLLQSIPTTLNSGEINHFGLISILLTVVFFGLIFRILFLQLFNKNTMKNTELELNVQGMTCNHCKASVEKNVSQIEGVEEVIAHPQQNKVYIKGSPKAEEVKAKITDLGFEVE